MGIETWPNSGLFWTIGGKTDFGDKISFCFFVVVLVVHVDYISRKGSFLTVSFISQKPTINVLP